MPQKQQYTEMTPAARQLADRLRRPMSVWLDGDAIDAVSAAQAMAVVYEERGTASLYCRDSGEVRKEAARLLRARGMRYRSFVSARRDGFSALILEDPDGRHHAWWESAAGEAYRADLADAWNRDAVRR